MNIAHRSALPPALALLATLALGACSGSGAHDLAAPSLPSLAGASSAQPSTPQGVVRVIKAGARALAACNEASSTGDAQCPSQLNLKYTPFNDPNASPGTIPGFHPADLQTAYNLPSLTAGAGQTIAVVDKGDDPTAEADLAVYRATFGLPPCTGLNGCFRKSNQPGSATNGTGLPPPDAAWSQEIALDLDMASAVCPNCKLLLVEANTANISDLRSAVDTAVKLGATVVSNSYYAPEYGTEPGDATHYNHPGVVITAAAGDAGYGPTFPAAASSVVAVGATTLTRDGSARGWSETAWSGTASGCSGYIEKPAWQHDAGCAKRTIADVAVVGDPDTGVAVYNSYAPVGYQGWVVMGGSSVGAPVVAGIYALAGNAKSLHSGAQGLYANAASFNPVTDGSNGTCAASYLCNAGEGYSGPGGLGSPNGIAAF